MGTIATVKEVTGKVIVKGEDGLLRTLKVGDAITNTDTIIVGQGRIVLIGINGDIVSLSEDQIVKIDDSIFQTEGSPSVVDSSISKDTIDDVIAVLDGQDDILKDLDATAAGLGAGGEGSAGSFVMLSRILEDINPLSFRFARARTDTIEELNGGEPGIQNSENREETTVTGEESSPIVETIEPSTVVSQEPETTSETGSTNSETSDTTEEVVGDGSSETTDNTTEDTPAVETEDVPTGESGDDETDGSTEPTIDQPVEPPVEEPPVVEPEEEPEEDSKGNKGHGNNTDGQDDDNPGQGSGGPNSQPKDGVDEDEKPKSNSGGNNQDAASGGSAGHPDVTVPEGAGSPGQGSSEERQVPPADQSNIPGDAGTSEDTSDQGGTETITDEDNGSETSGVDDNQEGDTRGDNSGDGNETDESERDELEQSDTDESNEHDTPPEDDEAPTGHSNNGLGNGQQDAPGNSGNAPGNPDAVDGSQGEDVKPGNGGNDGSSGNNDGGSSNSNSGSNSSTGNENTQGNQNNGWGNGDQEAPGNSGDNNRAENSEAINPLDVLDEEDDTVPLPGAEEKENKGKDIDSGNPIFEQINDVHNIIDDMKKDRGPDGG